eukprot:3337674-Pleurochrysis_carterae.AAC.1
MPTVGQDMARQSIPTAQTSGRVWVEQYNSAPTREWYVERSDASGTTPCSLAKRASSTRHGKSSPAGAWFLWKEEGTPSVGVGGNIDVKEVGHRAFVFNVPSRGVICGKGGVEGAWGCVRVEYKEVVHVATKDDGLGRTIDDFVAHKNARVGVRLLETPRFQPRKGGSLPAAASLSHAVNGLENAAYAGPAIGSRGLVPGGRMAVHNLTWLELAL